MSKPDHSTPTCARRSGAGAGVPGLPDLARRLQRLLDERGCSVAEAARLAELQHMQVYRIARGTNANPKVKTLEAIVTAIGSTMGELFADEDGPEGQGST